MQAPPFQPPPRFRGVQRIHWARFATTAPSFARRRSRSPRRQLGLRYERKVHEALLAAYASSYIPSPWLYFSADKAPPRFCQPDGLFLFPQRGEIIVCEIKWQHNLDAWWQLHKLYLPVLSAIFPPRQWRFHALEIVRWFDPDTDFPLASLCDAPLRAPAAPATGIHILRL